MRLSVLAPVLLGWLCAAPAMAAPTKNKIDPQAQEMLRQSAAAYGKLHSLTCDIRTELRLNGEVHGRVRQISLSYQKPSQAAVSVLKDGKTIQYFCDAKTIAVFSPAHNEYIRQAFPKDTPPGVPVLTQGESFVGLLLIKPIGLTSLADGINAKSLSLGPLETVDGVETRTVTRVVSRADGSTITFLVTLGVKDHLVHRFADVIQSPNLPVDGPEKVTRLDNSEVYSNIKVDITFPASTFQPPPGAKQITPDATAPK